MCFVKAEAKGPLTDYKYVEALAKCRRLARTEGIDAVMDKHKLDAIVAPTMGPACLTDLVNGDHWLGGSTSAAAVAGYPSITVPAGFVFGLPLGLSFFGRAWSEPTLLKLAYAFEQATKLRKPPRVSSDGTARRLSDVTSYVARLDERSHLVAPPYSGQSLSAEFPAVVTRRTLAREWRWP